MLAPQAPYGFFESQGRAGVLSAVVNAQAVHAPFAQGCIKGLDDMLLIALKLKAHSRV